MLFERQLNHNFEIPEVEYEVDFNEANNDTMVLLKSFFTLQNLKCEVFEGGLTNKLLRASFDMSGKKNVVLVRIYGENSDLLIDRAREKENMNLLGSIGYGPKLYGSFSNGIIYGYVEGRQFTAEDMTDSHLSQLVAKHMAEWHLVPTLDKDPQLFIILENWLHLLDKKFPNDSAVGYTNRQLWYEFYLLKSKIQKLKSPAVLCHNDIQVGNIIYNNENDSVTFIDLEYGCTSYRGFDIANHFCEFDALECEWKRFPDVEFRRRWLKKYLETFYGRECSETEIELVDSEVLAFCLCSHFMWSIWGILQSNLSNIEFDHIGYAQGRLKEYFSKKDSWLPN